MNGIVIAKRYARALLMTALEDEMVDQARSELALVLGTLEAAPGAMRFLRNPRISTDEKKRLLDELIEMLDLSSVMRGFLHVIVEKLRSDILGLIRREFERMAEEAAGIIRAKVTVAHEPKPGTVERLCGLLEKRTGRQVRLDVQVDPALIGGATLQMQSRLIDASLRGRLQLVRESLSA